MMEENPDHYRAYLLHRVSCGERIWLTTYTLGNRAVTFVLCGDGEEIAVAMASPPGDFWLTCGLIEQNRGETVNDYVDRCLQHQFQVVS